MQLIGQFEHVWGMALLRTSSKNNEQGVQRMHALFGFCGWRFSRASRPKSRRTSNCFRIRALNPFLGVAFRV